jgi:hypothetical protein
MKTQQNGNRRDIVFLGNLNHRLRSCQRASSTTQRAVGGDVDPLRLAKVDDFLLREGRVVLDLIDGGHSCSVGKQLLQVADAVVRNADCSDLACLQQLLHFFPCLYVGPILDDIARAVWEGGKPVVVS